MLANQITSAVLSGQLDLNRVPSGSGIDFIFWPIMVGAFIYFVYALTRKSAEEKRNKEEQK